MVKAEVCRCHGVSPATFYKWKGKFGGLEISDARKLRQLEEENARLKWLLADTIDNAQGDWSKKVLTPAAKRQAVLYLQTVSMSVSVARAMRLVSTGHCTLCEQAK